MNLQKKNRSPFSKNNSDSRKKEFINTINSLNYSIKELYTDFTKNVETEYYFINLLESKTDKSDTSIIEIINYLRIYKDLDKKSMEDFFEEAKIIFKKMKVLFNSLKQLINSNNSNNNHCINNILQKQKTSYNYIHIKNNLINNTDKLRPKAQTPIRMRTPNNSNVSLITQDSLKIIRLKISERDKEINNLKKKLKILEQKNNQFFQDFKSATKEKFEIENKFREITKRYEELQIKYSQLEKNYSQDMNIDNPAILALKDKLREVIHKYNTLTDLVKNLILNVNKNYKNENIINDIIKIIFGINKKI